MIKIKNIFAIFLFLVPICLFSQSQSLNKILDGTVPTDDAQWDPNWDWTANITYSYYIQGAPVYNSMRLPYFSNNGPAADDFHHGPDDSYSEVRDIYPEDGWVCLFRDFGTPQRNTDFPKIVLYNKYRGIIRFFYWIQDLNQDYNYAIVRLRRQVASEPFALFTFMDNENPYLDNYMEDRNETAVGKVLEGEWNYVNIPVIGFDPNLPEDAKFYFEIYGVKKSEVKLVLEGDFENVVDTAGVHRSKNNFNMGEVLNIGIQAYSTYKTFKTYDKERHNIIKNTKPGGVWASEWFGNILNSIAASSVFSTFVPALLPFASFFDGIVGGGKEKQAQPLHFKMDGTIDGEITFEPLLHTFMLRVPGSNHLGNDNIPFYDKPLGLFSLKTRPTYKVYERVFEVDDDPNNNGGLHLHTYNYINNVNIDYVYNKEVFSNITVENTYYVDNDTLQNPHGYFYYNTNDVFSPNGYGSYPYSIDGSNYTFGDHFFPVDFNVMYGYNNHAHKIGLRITLQPENPNHTATTLIKSYTPNYNIINTNDWSQGYKFGGAEIRTLPGYYFGTTEIDDNSINVQGSDGNDISYRLLLNEHKVLNINLCGQKTNFDTKLEIFNANGYTTGYYNDDGQYGNCIEDNELASSIQGISLDAGSYYIVIDGYNGASGNFDLEVTEDSGPTADFTISGLPYTHTSNNISTNNDWDVMGSDGNDVAYKLVLNSAKTIDISLCSSQTNFDTKLEVFDVYGKSKGYFNDDDFDCSINGTYSKLSNLSLAAGTYFIVVDGFNGETGNYQLNVSYTYNYDVTTIPFLHDGTNENSVDNWNVQGSDGKDISYRLVLNSGKTISVTTCGENTDFDTKLEIFNANGTTTGFYNDDTDDPDNCDWWPTSSTLEDVYLPAGTYYIVVDGYNGETGNYEIFITDGGLNKSNTNSDSMKNSNLFVDSDKILSNFDYEASKSGKKRTYKSNDEYKNEVSLQTDATIIDMEKDLNDGKPLPPKYFKASPKVNKDKVDKYEKDKKKKNDEKNNLELKSPYPSPGNPSTVISYFLPINTDVTIKIYNSLGKLVRTLIDEKQPNGNHKVEWNGLNMFGVRVASGVYFINLTAMNKKLTQKVIMLK